MANLTLEQANAELRKIVEGKLPATRAKISKFGVGAMVGSFAHLNQLDRFSQSPRAQRKN